MKVEINKLGEKIYHLKFSKQSEMTQTFMRFQEHFESPKFRGKIFSRNEYKKWYKFEHKGKFTYDKDWSGFNIPSHILKPFYEGKFGTLSAKESWMLKQFTGVKGKFYIVGTYDERKYSNNTLEHEIAHALFYLNKEYRAEVLNILSRVDLSKLKEKLAENAGYHKSVYVDECHAYIMCDLDWLKTIGKTATKSFKKTHDELRKVFKKYYAS